MKVPLTLIQIQVLLPYIDCTIRTKNSSMHSFLKAHHTTSFGTQSKVFFPNLQIKNQACDLSGFYWNSGFLEFF